jgi:hypothetical protein
MKPRKPLQRRTPLRATASLPRSTRLSRGPVKARREPAGGQEQQARLIVHGRAGGRCEICREAWATNYQHRKGKAHCSPAELWDPANGLAVCGQGNYSGCHGRLHQNPAEAYGNGWSVRSGHDPAEQPVLRRGEWVWLRPDGTVEPVRVGGAA